MGALAQPKTNKKSNHFRKHNRLVKTDFCQKFSPYNLQRMRPRGSFPNMRGGKVGPMRPVMGPPCMPPIRPLPPPPRGMRPIPPPPHGNGPRGPILPAGRMMCMPVRPPPLGVRPPPPPPPGMRPLPPHMMGARPLLPPPRRGMFRRGGPQNRNRKFQSFKGVQKGKIIKKRKSVLKDMDLSKPWVTESLKEEFKKKDELLSVAKKTQSKEDWASYRGQREKCSQMFHAAEMEFIGQQEDVSKNDSEVKTDISLEHKLMSQPPTETTNTEVATTT